MGLGCTVFRDFRRDFFFFCTYINDVTHNKYFAGKKSIGINAARSWSAVHLITAAGNASKRQWNNVTRAWKYELFCRARALLYIVYSRRVIASRSWKYNFRCTAPPRLVEIRLYYSFEMFPRAHMHRRSFKWRVYGGGAGLIAPWKLLIDSIASPSFLVRDNRHMNGGGHVAFQRNNSQSL